MAVRSRRSRSIPVSAFPILADRVSTLKPRDTYLKRPWTQCWAADVYVPCSIKNGAGTCGLRLVVRGGKGTAE